MGEAVTAAELLYGMPLIRSVAGDGAGAGAGVETAGCGALLVELKVIFSPNRSLNSGSLSVVRSFRPFACRCPCTLEGGLSMMVSSFAVACACVQQLWGEIGKSREERERMVRELEAECMRVYRRKVDEATGERAALHQSLAAGEAEIAALAAALGSDSGPQLKVLTSFHNLLLLVPDLMALQCSGCKTRCKLILANDRYAPSRGLLFSFR
jgi:Ase1/PRC1/MAP65 family protein